MNTQAVEIEDEDALLRRVANKPDMVKRDGQAVRPTSAVFKPASEDGGISVDVRKLLVDPTEPLSVLTETPEHGLVELRARVPRANQLDVVHTPQAGNPAHADIVNLGDLSRPLQKRARRELALASVWVRQPAVALG